VERYGVRIARRYLSRDEIDLFYESSVAGVERPRLGTKLGTIWYASFKKKSRFAVRSTFGPKIDFDEWFWTRIEDSAAETSVILADGARNFDNPRNRLQISFQ